jgi:hypothetical protein
MRANHMGRGKKNTGLIFVMTLYLFSPATDGAGDHFQELCAANFTASPVKSVLSLAVAGDLAAVRRCESRWQHQEAIFV